MNLESNYKQINTELEQSFITSYFSLLEIMFTVQFKVIPEFNIPRTLLTISNRVSESILQVSLASVTLLDLQGPRTFDTLPLCSKN